MADKPLDPKSIDVVKKLNELMGQYDRSILTASRSMQKLNKIQSTHNEEVQEFAEALSQIKKESKEETNEIKKSVKKIDKLNDSLEDSIGNLKDMGRALKSLHINKRLSTKDVVKYNKELRVSAYLFARINRDRNKGNITEKEAIKRMDDINKRLEKRKNIMEVKKDWTTKKGLSETAMGAFKTISSAPDIMSVMGNAAKGLSGILGKLIPGWAGLAFAGVKAFWDMGMAADEFVKNANKAFQMVRGPDIMTGNVKKQFKDFNDQIYKAGENIRVGLNVTQIRELMGAMAGAGLNITTLNKGLSNYRDAIYVAAKASKTLGVELPAVGNMMGTMINNFRMNMKKIDESFVQIAFDAKKSGLTTDAFWTTIQNANASLALYGVAIKSASKTMEAFTENAVGGADDAAAATTDMFNAFKSGDIGNKAALLQFSIQGGADPKKMFQKQVDDLNESIKNINTDIGKLGTPAKGSPEEEQLIKLRKELYSQQAQAESFTKAMNSDNAVEMSTQMGALAKDAPELIIDAIKGMIGNAGTDLSNLSNSEFIVAQQAAQTAGYSKDTVRMLTVLAQTTRNKLKDLSDRILKGGFSSLSDDEQKYLRDSSDEIASAIDKKNDPALAELLTKTKTINAVTMSQFKVDDKAKALLAMNAEDTFKAVVDQTLSYKEMIDIAKDEIQWRFNMYSGIKSLNDGVFSIFKEMTKDNKLTTGQKQAQSELIGTRKFSVGRSGKISEKDQAIGVISLAKNVDKLSTELKVRADYAKALSEPGSEKGLLASYDRSIATTTDPKTKTQMVAQKNALLNLLKEGKESGKSDEALIKLNEDAEKKATEQLNTDTKSLNNLITLDASNSDILEIAKLQLASDPEAQKIIAQKTQDYTLSNNYAGLERLRALSPDAAGSSTFTPASIPQMRAGGKKNDPGGPAIVGGAPGTKERGSEIMVPRGANIYPHGILPPSAALQHGGVGGAGGTKTFNININASANPQQIANVVQSTLASMNIT